MNAVTERYNYQAGSTTVPVIPYDTFEAANLFLATGRSTKEVLPELGLTNAEWDMLHEVYRWFPYSLGEDSRRRYFNGLDDASICQLVLPPRWKPTDGAEPDLRSTEFVREAVRLNPRIGPFADCDWPMTWIAAHPEATLCSYTHDNHTVFFKGKPLTDRKGAPINVDVMSLRTIGGRWLYDKDHVYGQGQYGANSTFYWFKVDGADAKTFVALNLLYARDKNQAYYITGKTIRTRSPDAFSIVPHVRLNYRDTTCDFLHDNSVVARDREAIYFYGARLRGAKPDGFRELGHGYAKNHEKVWYLEEKKIIEGADAKTFTVPGPGDPDVKGLTSGHFVTDRNRPYVRGEPRNPVEWFEAWRPFFEARSDIEDWWWHKLDKDHCAI
ncbi:hypothetical protein FS799_18770 [Agrobacterium vitis]|uniref:DKNYY domain-containing protein n=1 Tax=Agrobacterium vitis TaxID=373 RepID=UPI000872580D|nr:DKNYY domain-containing protein [Agrobacterium vitis]MCE6076902.1 hypothetical protein [Agrobacterium vitis]MCF1455487.1 hypothetical protein [Agrobacterium vitis]MUO71286.1 hypothetical protein [Agrobacterium vitis]MUO87712.1 hypothetical protein [Agrobacterium vitis]